VENTNPVDTMVHTEEDRPAKVTIEQVGHIGESLYNEPRQSLGLAMSRKLPLATASTDAVNFQAAGVTDFHSAIALGR